MATAADLREIERESPWLREDFQAGLAALRESTVEEARRYARDMHRLAELTAQVPRCAFDDRGATPWTSFRREIAVARRVSDRGAAALIRQATALTVMPRTAGLLAAGEVTVQQARVLLTELETVGDPVRRLVDDRLADRLPRLSAARIVQEARKAVLTADPDQAARRAADGNDGRDVTHTPDPDDQAHVVLTGPAVPLTRWYQALDRQARACKAAGDPRTLAQLRFDLATAAGPCTAHAPASDAAPAGQRPAFVEPAAADCRLSRPVQAHITVPVETGLGLSNEPGWLDGYGWLSAPTCRLLLVDAELRRVCTHTPSGQILDLDQRDRRPPPTYTGLRHALVDFVLAPATLSGAAGTHEHQHDPSPSLRRLVELRDRYDDGPTGTLTPASRCDLDHDEPWPAGPTAAWNLTARAARTHQLKHHGWTPLRTPTATWWVSPAGQIVEAPRHQQAPPGIDRDPHGPPATLPDPDELARTDLAQLQPSTADDHPPYPHEPPGATAWTWLTEPPPF